MSGSQSPRLTARVDRVGGLLAVCIPVGLAGLVWWRIVFASFFADDFVWMYRFANGSPLRVIFEPFAGHTLAVRNAIFWLFFTSFGVWGVPYYLSVLLVHLTNVGLVADVGYRLTGERWAGALAAVAWGTCPLHVEPLGWYSVFGHVLAGTFLLVALRVVLVSGPMGIVPRQIVIPALALLLGANCFGTGVGAAVGFPVAVFCLAPQSWERRPVRWALLAIPVVVVGLYAVLQAVHALAGRAPEGEAVVFRLASREIWPAFAMLAHLVGFGATSLILGSWFSYADYPGPLATWTLGVLMVTVVASLVVDDGPRRRVLLGLALLTLSLYGIVAVGRTNAFAAFGATAAQAAIQRRYHYGATIPLVLGMAVVLSDSLRWRPSRVPWLLLVSALGISLLVVGYGRRTWRVETRPLVAGWVRNGIRTVKATIDAQPQGVPVYIPNPETPSWILGPALNPTLFPGWAGLYVIAFPEEGPNDRKVYFVDRNKWLTGFAAQMRASGSSGRAAHLLVSPEEMVARGGALAEVVVPAPDPAELAEFHRGNRSDP